MVDQEISQHRAAEGSDERCHHRVSQGRAPLSQNRKCERFWTLPRAPAARPRASATANGRRFSTDRRSDRALAQDLIECLPDGHGRRFPCIKGISTNLSPRRNEGVAPKRGLCRRINVSAELSLALDGLWP